MRINRATRLLSEKIGSNISMSIYVFSIKAGISSVCYAVGYITHQDFYISNYEISTKMGQKS